MAFRGIKKWETPASTAKKVSVHSNIRRIPADTRAREVAAQETLRTEQKEGKHLSRFASVSDLRKYLELRGMHDACQSVVEGVSECDPLKYESVMLNDLIEARVNGYSPEEINRLRDLILAGSSPTYTRKDEQEILSEFTLLREMKRRHPEVITKLSSVKTHEDEQWGKRKRDVLRDPSTLLEMERDRAEASDELANVETCVRRRMIGEDTEEATRTVENLLLRNWTELKKILIAHGLTVDIARDHAVTRPLADAIEDLRHIRDLLYYRRIHPDWAKIAIQGEKKLSA